MASDENQHAPIAAVNIHSSNDDDDEEVDDVEEDEETEEEEEDEDDGEVAGENDNGVDEAAAAEEEEVEAEEDRNVSLNSDPARGVVTVAVPPPSVVIVQASSIVTAKRPGIFEDDAIGEPIGEPIGERRVNQAADDQARKLFQRLWTDEDEIGLLRGFLDYSTLRGTSQNNPHDTALFYDRIKSKLQLDFNKNQLVEKLRRLKKKYRNVLARVSSGKEIQFKSPHDQATFEIASKIWGTGQNSQNSKDQIHQQLQHQHQQMRGADLDDDMPPNFNPASANLNLNLAGNLNNFNSSGGYSNHHHSDRAVVDEWKSQLQQQKAKKRIRVKMEDSRSLMDPKGGAAAVASNSSPSQNPIWPQGMGLSTPSMVEETVKNRIPPLLYERYGARGVGGIGGLGDGIVSPVPLSFASPVNAFGLEVADDRWRKQHILELEVYSKRLELVQEQIKLTLEQLRSTGS